MVLLRVDGSHVDPRRIMLTGANGFAGGYMRSALRTAFPDAELIATGRASAPGLVNLDVTDHASVAELLRATKPDVVIHLAAIALPGEARKHPGLARSVLANPSHNSALLLSIQRRESQTTIRCKPAGASTIGMV